MAAGYSGREVNALEPRVDKNIQELIRLLDTKIVDQIVEERYSSNNKIHSGDILSSFAAYSMTGKEAKSEIMVQIMAGSNTIATAIRATLLHIITNPVVLRKLRSEIATAGLTADIISNTQARTLPYLQAVIKEGLRIHPPVSSLSVKEVPKTGDTFKGMYFPPGTKLGISMWALTRNRDLFGEDADEFRPERWIEAKNAADEEEKKGDSEARAKLKEMEFSVDLIFGHGKWGCLGKNIALMELNKVFLELLRRYDFVVLNPMKPWDSKHSGVFSQKDFWLKAYKREDVSV
ncbi:putative Pisatin demethylase [Sordaria brevicollis]|uniref:Pisatin demethylase n=1 Tax=Sordaria brevicollis TaxID=83679 RepID=A0AAE0NRT0_SORBR|nr:putative Pisatin demethylase [Sordaria brevicollis]